jgi:hypothetical protein
MTNLTNSEAAGGNSRESLNTGGKGRGGNSEHGELHLGVVLVWRELKKKGVNLISPSKDIVSFEERMLDTIDAFLHPPPPQRNTPRTKAHPFTSLRPKCVFPDVFPWAQR